MTRAIAADLERRGYIVYITVSSADEEHLVQYEHRADIKALWLDLTTVSIHDRPKLNNSNRNRSLLHYQKSIHRCMNFAP